MKVLLIEPGKVPAEKEIPHTLDALQEMVGGTVQAIYPFDDPVALLCNDDGKLLGLPMNRALHESSDIICGPFAIVSAPPGANNFTSLTEEQIQRYTKRFWFPEQFLSIAGAVFVLPDSLLTERG